MIKLKFTPEIIDQLHHERTNHPHPRVRQRMEAVYLKALGLSHQEIGRIVRISQNTMCEYLQMYQQGGAEFLKKLGLKRRKVGQIPAKADPEKQQRFLDESLTLRLTQAQANQRHLFFVDAAHFVLQSFLGFLSSASIKPLPTDSGSMYGECCTPPPDNW